MARDFSRNLQSGRKMPGTSAVQQQNWLILNYIFVQEGGTSCGY